MTIELRQGARTHYGPRETEDKVAGKVRVDGHYDELHLNFKFDDLPGGSVDDAVASFIPANAVVVSADLFVHTAFASTSGTTTIDVGVEEADGTDIDVDGFVVDVTADAGTTGWVIGGGALVGASVGADPAYVTVVSSADDLTAGEATLIVRYAQAPVATPSV